MRPYDAAALIGVAASTLRTWSAGEFKPYLSPTGQGGDGRTRDFTDLDVRVLALVDELKKKGTPHDEIHDTLRRMQAADWAGLPPMPIAPPGVGPVEMIPRAQAETAIETMRDGFRRDVLALQDRIDELKAELASEREGRAEDAKQREDLLKQLVEAQTELRLWREGRLKPE